MKHTYTGNSNSPSKVTLPVRSFEERKIEALKSGETDATAIVKKDKPVKPKNPFFRALKINVTKEQKMSASAVTVTPIV